MRKKLCILATLTTVIITISILLFNTTERIPIIEDTFDNFIAYYSKPIEDLYWMTNKGDRLYRIENNDLCFYTVNQTPIVQIALPFAKNDIQTIDLFNDTLMIISVADLNKTDSVTLYSVDLTSNTVNQIDTKQNFIYEIDGLYSEPNKLYVKYHNFEASSQVKKSYYGYLNLQTGVCTPISEITDHNKFDVYLQEQLAFKLTMGNSDVIVHDAIDNAMFTFPRALYSKQYANTNRFRKLMYYEAFASNTIYYIDPTQNAYGTLMKFDGNSKKIFKVPHKLKGHVTKISTLQNGGLLINYGDDGFCEIYDPNSSNVLISNFIKNKVSIEVLKVSSDYTKLLYSENYDNGNSALKYVNLNNQSDSTLINYKHLVSFNKVSKIIKDENNNDLQFYLMQHEDSTKRPVAIFIHGGPFSRFDKTGFDESHLILYELGFNVVQLNFHGSTNLGLTYYKNGAPNIAKSSMENVSTVLSWIEEQPNMNSKQVALIGSSYGGYATMISKFALKEKISVAVALLPGSLDDFSPYNFDVFQEMHSEPSSYDNWALAKTTDQPIGIIYAPFDTQLRGSKDWQTISRSNKKIQVIKTLGSKHVVSLRDFKHVVYYINQYIPIPAIK